MNQGLKIAIVVQGRFHALDLARELTRKGNEVVVLTNYPKSIVARCGVPEHQVLSCLGHGLVSRLVHRWPAARVHKALEPQLHRWFSRWAAGKLNECANLDAIHSFSGVSEEILRQFPRRRPLRSLVRGSAHIVIQAGLLAAEQMRCGCPLNQPSPWMIARELREYELSDL
ncbi:MAG TPA: glycosyltransferase, partial [Verrucomicrobiae bacterium]|nr:glycosyltransferase [Verrucomicrobiae bacterium]